MQLALQILDPGREFFEQGWLSNDAVWIDQFSIGTPNVLRKLHTNW